jgi:hypothetical protein
MIDPSGRSLRLVTLPSNAAKVNSISRGMAQSDRGQPHRAFLNDESRSSDNARPALWPHH